MRPSQARAASHSQRGYVLLVLLLMISMMAIAALVVLTPMKFQIERDREEEMIHRGVQYTRAVRKYFRKFNRYPTKLEDLDSSNNTRYLRKHYKDPVTGQDFKLLHYGDPGVRMGGLAGLLGQANQPNLNPGSDPSQPGGPGPGFGPGPAGSQPGSQPGSPFSGPGQPQDPGGARGGQAGGNPTDNSTPGPTAGDANSGGAYTPNSPGGATPGDSPGATQSTGFGTGNAPSFGGGAIVGVASASKKNTIREFNHKKKYNEWQFIYDPSSNRGGIPMTPNQPSLPGVGNLSGPPGVNPLGQPNPIGSPNGVNPQDNSNPAPGTTPPGSIQQ